MRSESFMTYSEKVIEAMQQSNMESMEENIKQAMQYDSDDYLMALQEVLIQAGYIDLAQPLIQHLLEKTHNPALYLSLAEIAIENNHIDEAFEALEHIDKDSEYYIQALVITADLYQVLGVPEVSEQKLKEAKTLTDDPLITFALAELYNSIAALDQAKKLYEELIHDGIEQLANVSLNERLGELLMNQGKFEDALAIYNDMTELTPHMRFLQALAYYHLNEYEKALAIFKELHDKHSELTAVSFYLAECLMKENQLEEALSIAEQGLKDEPLNIQLYLLVAELCYRQNNISEAEHYLRQALEIDDFNGGDQARLALTTFYITEERGEEALELLNDVNETDGYVHWLLAQAYRLEEDYDQAMEHYDQARVEMDHDLLFMRDYGLMLREEGRLEEAYKQLSHYSQHQPDDIEIAELLMEFNEE